jgi:hypothetical protein
MLGEVVKPGELAAHSCVQPLKRRKILVAWADPRRLLQRSDVVRRSGITRSQHLRFFSIYPNRKASRAEKVLSTLRFHGVTYCCIPTRGKTRYLSEHYWCEWHCLANSFLVSWWLSTSQLANNYACQPHGLRQRVDIANATKAIAGRVVY